MNQSSKGEPILQKVYIMKKMEREVIEYSVKEGYGSGKVLYYEIYEGVYVIYSDYYIKLIKNMDGIKFKDNVISMYRMYEGTNVTKISDDKSVIVKNGDMVNFAGNSEFFESDGYGNHITSVGVFGYYKSVLKMFDDIFGSVESRELVRDYYASMITNTPFIICRNDIRYEVIFNELLDSVQRNNRILMKLKALELMQHEMVNYSTHLREKHKTYDNYYIEKVYEIKSFIDENWKEKASIEDLAREYKINKTYLKEIFKERFSISLHKYVIRLRLEKSKELLLNKELKIEEIAFMTGFSSAGRYSENFKKNFGYLPSKYRNQN